MRVSQLTTLLATGLSFGATPYSQDLQVRLNTPIASYSKPGTPFTARVLGPLNDRAPLLPVGSLIHGSVRQARSIGLGFRRERASLEIEFQSCELPTGDSVPCEVRLHTVDNARETVTKPNHIQGVLAASCPQSWLSGVWYRPAPALFHRSAAGLTGAGGMIETKFPEGGLGAAAVIVSRLVLFRMPDPDIELPAGTDLIVHVSTGAEPEPDPVRAAPSSDIAETVQKAPSEILFPDHTPAADIINFAFVATDAELTQAFEAAGWTLAETLTAKTFTRTYTAMTAMRAYPGAPVSKLYYGDRLPDLVFQKTLNSMAKRHHIRLWNVGTPERPLWLGAATHDVAIGFDWRRLTVTHRIDPQIDRERETVVNDLAAAGCLAAASVVERPELARQTAVSSTGGAAIIATLKPCGPAAVGPALHRPHRSLAVLGLRRVILETRHYITRGNAYYLAYRAVRWSFSPKRALGGEHE